MLAVREVTERAERGPLEFNDTEEFEGAEGGWRREKLEHCH